MSMQTTGNNPGMKLFMGKIKGVRPKLLVPHPSRARLPNAAQLDESVQTPLGIQKGSSSIHIKPSHKGLFTAKAKSAGMGVQGYASKVLSEGSRASAATRRQANFARNAAKWNH
jgi:hypothetical protein